MKRVYKTPLVILTLLLFFLTYCGSGPSKFQKSKPVDGIPHLTNRALYCVYYGRWTQELINKAKKYKLVILHPKSNITPEWISELKDSGVLVLGYLSIGEDEILHGKEFSGGTPGADGIHANWYYYDKEGKIRKNPNWNSYYVNVSNPYWKKALKNFTNKDREGWYGYDYILNTLGCNGLFLDTLDTVSPWMSFPSYQQISEMANLVASIRENIGRRKIIVVNRGLFYCDTKVPGMSREAQDTLRGAINGMMYESYFNDTDRLYWATKVNTEARKADGFSVFALDYNVDINKFCQATIIEQGWTSYIACASLQDGIHDEVKNWITSKNPPVINNPPR
ncbi:MAG TPA: hypothetical protein EYP78_02445 [Candidatus Omnitrophica bacterium]|nr:hypothetical protein [Candidatus Omnitrophota bacterium]